MSFLWELNWLPRQVAGVSGSDSPLEDLLVHLRKHYAFVVPRDAFASPAAVGTLSRQTPSQFAVSFSAPCRVCFITALQHCTLCVVFICTFDSYIH